MFHPRVFKFKSEDLVYSVENNGRLDQLDFFIRAPDVSCQWPSVLARRLRHTLAAVLSISISEFIQFRIPVRPPACAPCTNGDGGQRSFGKMQKKLPFGSAFSYPFPFYLSLIDQELIKKSAVQYHEESVSDGCNLVPCRIHCRYFGQ